MKDGLDVDAVVLAKLAQEIEADLQDYLTKSQGTQTPWSGARVFTTRIRRNIKLAEAPSFGKPILLYDNDCAGSRAYIRLATEIIERERQYKAA